MLRKFKERISVFAVKEPSLTILIAILLLNLVLFAIAAFVISGLAPESLSYSGFWVSVYYTISMVLDAGCISYVIADIGEASVALKNAAKELGCDTFVEFGPGKVLSGLVKKIDVSLKTFNVADLASLEATAGGL